MSLKDKVMNLLFDEDEIDAKKKKRTKTGSLSAIEDNIKKDSELIIPTFNNIKISNVVFEDMAFMVLYKNGNGELRKLKCLYKQDADGFLFVGNPEDKIKDILNATVKFLMNIARTDDIDDTSEIKSHKANILSLELNKTSFVIDYEMDGDTFRATFIATPNEILLNDSKISYGFEHGITTKDGLCIQGFYYNEVIEKLLKDSFDIFTNKMVKEN